MANITEILGTFDVHLKNALPIGFQFQAYFIDESQNSILDSLFINLLIDSVIGMVTLWILAS